jgi:SAM-dependent methyltransferase
MDERVNQIAAVANALAYNAEATRDYIDGAPHIKHASLRQLYSSLVVRVFDNAREQSTVPRVLDLGAGEGAVTLPFLELGARVVAVDISDSQLKVLREKCGRFQGMLDVRCEDISSTLRDTREKYDIVVVNSFLHHIPDYLGLIRDAVPVLSPRGQFFSFQDPLRYDSLGAFTTTFSTLAYGGWRIFKGDVLGGVKRRLRRARGVYLEDSVHDNAEYHVMRNGVDQDAIYELLGSLNCDCDLVKYFSTQSAVFQPIGRALGLENTFAVIGQRRS